LALGTPAAVLAGVAQAARNGVLVKGGAHLENLGRIRAIAFDKTGTITHGKPEVTDIVTFNGMLEADLLRLAAGVEAHSAHPLARAIVQAAQAGGLEVEAWDEATALPGLGLQATRQGRTLWIGSRAMLIEQGVLVSQDALEQAQTLEEEGKTLTWLAQDGQALGLIALSDTIRAGTPAVLRRLNAMGIESAVLLTGDHEQAARSIAAQAGFDEIQAELMPADKLEKVGELLGEYEYVAMVGDGVNDAPALALATVGIAMGGAGSDAALESADVALMGDDLSRLPFAVGLGRATRSVIVQNLAIALGVIALLGVAAIAGWVGIGIAVIFHEGSTLVVVANALRLLRYKNEPLRS
jgi:Cd2+/Zn2+-exporting ATPase